MGTRDEGPVTVQHSKKTHILFQIGKLLWVPSSVPKPDMLTEVLMCQYLKLFKNIFRNKSCDSGIHVSVILLYSCSDKKLGLRVLTRKYHCEHTHGK